VSEAANSTGEAGSPDPAGAQTAAEFMEVLRQLKRWTGEGYRQLEKRAGTAGQPLPRSTLTAALARDTLPREDLVVAFVRACGGDDAEVRRWADARRRIAATTGPGDPEPAPGSVWADLVPPAIRRANWPVRVMVAALVAVVAITVVAAVASTVRDLTRPAGTDLAGDRPSGAGPATSPSPVAPSGTGDRWVEVRSADNVTLDDEQAIDFDTGTIGHWNDHNPGFDVGLSHRADRLVTPRPPASVAVLDTPGEVSPYRCTAASQWDGGIHGLRGIRAGRNICVTTGERRCVMITVDSPPDGVVTVLAFHYTVWERR